VTVRYGDSLEQDLERLVEKVQREDPKLATDEAWMRVLETDQGRGLYGAYAKLRSASDNVFWPRMRDDANVATEMYAEVKKSERSITPEAVCRWLETEDGKKWYARNYG
jgi:hypothetical protein